MVCQILFRSVNGVTASGATQPTRLRVTGYAYDCAGGVLLTSNVTAPMTSPATVDGNGRFLIDVPLVGSVQCGDQVGVTVTCAGNPACSATRPAAPLECCQVSIVSVDGVVPQGSVTPTAVRVMGTLYGCASDQVTINAIGVTAPLTVSVDPLTGSFIEQLPITAPGILCGARFVVTADCVGSAGCHAEHDVKDFSCPQCFRAQIGAMVGPCSGAPAQASVTLTAQIGLTANGSGQFAWVFGDGSPNQPFTATVANGAPGATTSVATTHTYGSGTYTVELRRTDLGECPPVQYTFTVDCDRCPTLTPAVVVGDCEPPGPRQGSRQVTYTLSFTPPLGPNDTAYATIFYGGQDVNGATSGMAQRTGPGPLVHSAYLTHRPGGYTSTATVTVLGPGNAALCIPPSPPVTFTNRPSTAAPGVDVAPCLPCPTAVQVSISQPPLVPPPHRQFDALVTWPGPNPPPPPPYPVAHDWTVTLPDGRQARIAGGPGSVTTQAVSGWTGTGSLGGAVDISLGGTYAVSVTAKFAASAGLPTDPLTGVPSCNLTGAGTFPLSGPPPQCASLTGVGVTTPACADDTQQVSAAIGFTATVQNANLVTGPYRWDFGDPSSPSNSTQTSTPTAQHSYTKPGTYLVTVTLAATASCAESTVQGTVTIGRCPCPDGQTRNADGVCVTTPGTPPPPPPPRTSSTLCCFLIGAWVVLSVVFTLLLYYGVVSMWPFGTIISIVVGGLATVALVFWVILCCWPCFATFWRCCVFWQWQLVMVGISVAIMGLLTAVGVWIPVLAGNPVVLGVYSGYVFVVLGVLSAIGNCGSLPNPLDPRTWPACCCPGSTCP